MLEAIEHTSNEFLIYGLKLKGLEEPFNIGNLTIYPSYDLRKLLACFDEEKVQSVIDSGALYANCVLNIRREPTKIVIEPSPDECDEYAYLSITAIRLFKAGWILPKSIMPVKDFGDGKAWQELEEPQPEQMWAEPMFYALNRQDIEKIQALYQKLLNVWGDYLSVALRRFNRSYEYWAYPATDDCLVDLVIALESILSRGGDGILQSMKLRGSMLLAKNNVQRKSIEKKINDAYEHRSRILHGEKTSKKDFEKRFIILEEIRSLLRATINASINLLSLPDVVLQKTLAETIDDYFYNKLAKSKPRLKSSAY